MLAVEKNITCHCGSLLIIVWSSNFNIDIKPDEEINKKNEHKVYDKQKSQAIHNE